MNYSNKVINSYKKKNMDEKVLFVVPEFDIKGPRGIRVENILSESQNDNFYLVKFKIHLNESYPSTFHFRLSSLYKTLYKFNLFRLVRRVMRNHYLDRESLFLSIITKDIRRIIERYKIDKLVILCSPFSLYSIAPILRNIYPDIKLIYDIGDPFYLNSNKKKYSGKMDKERLEKTMLDNSNGFIVTNEATKLMFHQHYKIPLKKLEVIPQGVNIELIKSYEGEFIDSNSQKLNIVYSGIFYKDLRDPSILFSVIEETDAIQLDIYGSNLNYKYKNICFHKRMIQIQLFRKMNKSDVLLFIDNSSGIQTPGKIFEILAFKKNVLFIYDNEESATLYFVRQLDANNIFIVKNEYESIRNIIVSGALQRKYSANYDIDDFSWKERSRKYTHFLDQI